MNSLRDWCKIGHTDHGTSLFLTPAILRRRHDEWQSVRIYWRTDHESFVVEPDGKMTYIDGDQIHVLVSTVTSSVLGCINGHARIEAIETAPGQWSRNRR